MVAVCVAGVGQCASLKIRRCKLPCFNSKSECMESRKNSDLRRSLRVVSARFRRSAGVACDPSRLNSIIFWCKKCFFRCIMPVQILCRNKSGV